MKLVLLIDRPTPSNNELINRVRGRLHYRIIRKQWLTWVGDAYLVARAEAGRREIWPRPPRRRIRVTFERFTRTYDALDRENMAGGCKPALDALVKLQLIDDDHSRPVSTRRRKPGAAPARHGIEPVFLQPKNPHTHPRAWTRITLEAIEPEGGAHA